MNNIKKKYKKKEAREIVKYKCGVELSRDRNKEADIKTVNNTRNLLIQIQCKFILLYN